MHVAVVMDQYAYRKQMERLLGRASDRMAAEHGVLYIDSYGNAEALMHKYMLYDFFLIDLSEKPEDTIALMHKLRIFGVNAPIALCSAEDRDYATIYSNLIAREEASEKDDPWYINQPILVNELDEILLRAQEALTRKIPMVELRDDRETYYLQEDELICAERGKDFIHVTLTEGRSLEIPGTMDSFCEQISCYSHYYRLSSRIMINLIYLDSISHFSAHLKDGTSFRIVGYNRKQLDRLLAEIAKETL